MVLIWLFRTCGINCTTSTILRSKEEQLNNKIWVKVLFNMSKFIHIMVPKNFALKFTRNFMTLQKYGKVGQKYRFEP